MTKGWRDNPLLSLGEKTAPCWVELGVFHETYLFKCGTPGWDFAGGRGYVPLVCLRPSQPARSAARVRRGLSRTEPQRAPAGGPTLRFPRVCIRVAPEPRPAQRGPPEAKGRGE